MLPTISVVVGEQDDQSDISSIAHNADIVSFLPSSPRTLQRTIISGPFRKDHSKANVVSASSSSRLKAAANQRRWRALLRCVAVPLMVFLGTILLLLLRSFGMSTLHLPNKSGTQNITTATAPLGPLYWSSNDAAAAAAQLRKKNNHSTIGSSSGVVVIHPNEAAPPEGVVVKIRVIVQLSGELGNHLATLAAGLGVALLLQSHTPSIETANSNSNINNSKHGDTATTVPVTIRADLQLRHQEHTTKWVHVVQDEWQRCFPQTRGLNVSQAQTTEWPTHKDDPYAGVNGNDAARVDAAIALAVHNAVAAVASDVGDGDYNANDDDSIVTLYVHHLVALDMYMDRFYDAYRAYFAMDPLCCASVVADESSFPAPDEVVFHYRNYVHEMPRKGVALGYEEVDPHYLPLLIDSAAPQSKAPVAIVSRFPETAEPMADALRNADHPVRIVSNHTGTQDFCFLSRANSMVGLGRSTYFVWAAILSNASNVVAYSVNSTAKRSWANQHNIPVLDAYSWTNPGLEQRFRFQLIDTQAP